MVTGPKKECEHRIALTAGVSCAKILNIFDIFKN